MNIAAASRILNQKEPPRLYEVVGPALEDPELRRVLVEGSFDKNETLRYNCVRVLFCSIEQRPAVFYPFWDRCASMLDSTNGFHRSVAAQAIAHLSTVDTDCRLDGIFDRYLGLLDDSKVMVAHYFIETVDMTYRARRDLRSRIFAALLSIDQTRHPAQHRDLLKADILGVFDRLFDILPIEERKRTLIFAKAALKCSSAKSRKAAKLFEDRHPN